MMKMNEFPKVTVWLLQQRLHIIVVDSSAVKKSQIVLDRCAKTSWKERHFLSSKGGDFTPRKELAKNNERPL